MIKKLLLNQNQTNTTNNLKNSNVLRQNTNDKKDLHSSYLNKITRTDSSPLIDDKQKTLKSEHSPNNFLKYRQKSQKQAIEYKNVYVSLLDQKSNGLQKQASFYKQDKCTNNQPIKNSQNNNIEQKQIANLQSLNQQKNEKDQIVAQNTISSQNNSTKNDFINTNYQIQDQFQPVNCVFHKDKKVINQTNNFQAKYIVQIEQNKQQFICSKCAVDATIKQQKIIEISQVKICENIMKEEPQVINVKPFNLENLNNEQKQRQELIKKFIYKLQETIQNGISQNQEINEQKQQLIKYYVNQKNISEEIFSYFKQSIEEQQQIQLKKIDNTLQEQQEVLQKKEKSIIQNLHDMENIKSDIHQNIENILVSMDIKPFSLIIQKYTEKLEMYSKNLQSDVQARLLKFHNENLFQSFKKDYKKLINDIFQSDDNAEVDCQMLESEVIEFHINRLHTPMQEVMISFQNKELFQNASKEYKDESKNVTVSNSLGTPISERLSKECYTPKNRSLGAEIGNPNIIRSPNNAKYLDLLNKVNANQINTNTFYQQILQNPKIQSPILDSQNFLKKKDKNLQENDKQQQGQFQNIDNYLNNEENKPPSNYQKNLFKSPHFKQQNDSNE